jgi:hypothetical protein
MDGFGMTDGEWAFTFAFYSLIIAELGPNPRPAKRATIGIKNLRLQISDLKVNVINGIEESTGNLACQGKRNQGDEYPPGGRR